MKNRLFILLSVCFLSGSIYAQTPVRYKHDKAGNVVLRCKITVQNLQRSVRESNTEMLPETIAGKTMKVYPNPTRGIVKIEFLGPGGAIDIRTQLFDSKGALLRSDTGNSSVPLSVDMTSYPRNWYILKIYAGEDVKEYKIIKE